jgi:hypothetical protein
MSRIATAAGREHTTWAGFLRSQPEALLACDFFETRTLAGTRLYVFAVIEHATRRIRILGATAHPTGPPTAQTAAPPVSRAGMRLPRPDRWDILGALICLVGVAVIMYVPRDR